MKTGVVLRKLRMIGTGANAKEVTEYEINWALIECLNSVEHRAAIETGQEVDRTDVNMRLGVNAKADLLQRVFTLEELEWIEKRIDAGEPPPPKQLPAPAEVVEEVKPAAAPKTNGHTPDWRE